MTARHHIVSQGYLRHFADGKRIRLIEKQTGESKVVGVRDTFVEKGFNSLNVVGADVNELEKEWARVEGQALPDVRRLIAGERDSRGEYGVRVLMALHWARSYVFREMYKESFRKTWSRAPADIASKPSVIGAFVSEYGREPTPGEIESMVSTRADEIGAQNAIFVERMTTLFNKAMDERFLHLHLEVVRVVGRRYGLITGDSPVVLIRDPLKVDLRRTVPLLQADGIFMPLSHWVGAFLTSNPEPEKPVFPFGVQQLNNLTWRSARRRVACHPDENWHRACAVSAASMQADESEALLERSRICA